MYERISLQLGRLYLGLTSGLSSLKREEGQGATEYAMVIGFLTILLIAGLGILGVSIGNFLQRVATKVDGLVP
jgi:Flp pilus assembly pilin Flp